MVQTKDRGPCTHFVLRCHSHTAGTWVTPRPCPFTRPCGRKGSTTQRAGNALRGRQTGAGWPQRHPHSDGNHELGRPVLPWRHSPPPENSGAGSACALPSPAPSTAGGGRRGTSQAQPPRPLRPPFLPQLAWALHPQASFLHFPVPRIRGRGDQGARVFCLLAGAVI